MSLLDNIQERLNDRKQQGNLRALQSVQNLVDFVSNDYLGFAREKSTHQHFPGSGGSRLLGGNYPEIVALEKEIAAFFNAESALVFNSGYSANTGILSCLLEKGDTYIYDELVHASMRDGMRLSFANAYSFKHNDTSDLEKKLKAAKGKCVVLVESVYSMDGDNAPLKSLAEICKNYQAQLIVDEAHAVGLFGESGRGLVNELNLEHETFARIITFGKALGCHGAAILGKEILKQFLINYSRQFIYTTALPPSSATDVHMSLNRLARSQNNIQQLKHNIAFFRKECKRLGIEMVIESKSAIQVIIIPGNEKVKIIADQLQKQGFYVKAVMSPTVAAGKERIRFCLHAFNTENEITGLLSALKKLMHE